MSYIETRIYSIQLYSIVFKERDMYIFENFTIFILKGLRTGKKTA